MKFPKGIHKTRKPKMTDHRGRTWDYCRVVLPDGKMIDGYFDTSWGTRFYFEHEGVWRSGDIHAWDKGSNCVVCDLTKEPNP